jgi:hypothetical protein
MSGRRSKSGSITIPERASAASLQGRARNQSRTVGEMRNGNIIIITVAGEAAAPRAEGRWGEFIPQHNVINAVSKLSSAYHRYSMYAADDRGGYLVKLCDKQVAEE